MYSTLRTIALVTALAGAGCAAPGSEGPRRPGWTSAPAVSLDGTRVLVVPAQRVRGISGDVNAELAFGLATRGPRVSWILPGELREALERSPGILASPDALPVGVFLEAEVRRIGDPLYGELRRMGALTDAAVAFLPISVRARAAGDSVPAGVEILAALVDVRTGAVLWTGMTEGLGESGSAAALAAAVDALAVAMLGATATPAGPAYDGMEHDETSILSSPSPGGPRRLRPGAAASAHAAGGGGVLYLFR